MVVIFMLTDLLIETQPARGHIRGSASLKCDELDCVPRYRH